MSAAGQPRPGRDRIQGQCGCVVWFTGLSGSGKTTLGRALEARLLGERRVAFLLDGDDIRGGLSRDLAFSIEDRVENLRRVAEVARLFADCGVICITAFISPLRSNRGMARGIVGADRFFEVHLDANLAACEGRDPKGLYRRAREGLIPDFTGISSPYEAPGRPALRLDTVGASAAENVGRLVDLLATAGMVDPTAP